MSGRLVLGWPVVKKAAYCIELLQVHCTYLSQRTQDCISEPKSLNRARSTDLKGWRCGVLIPIPLACQASALPPELHPQQGKITAIMSQILYLIALLLWKIIKLGCSMTITPLSQSPGLILLMNTKHCMVILIIKDSNWTLSTRSTQATKSTGTQNIVDNQPKEHQTISHLEKEKEWEKTWQTASGS